MAAHTSEINTSSNCSSLAWCHQTPAELGASGPTSLLQDRTALEQRAARALSVDVQLQVGVEECRGSDWRLGQHVRVKCSTLGWESAGSQWRNRENKDLKERELGEGPHYQEIITKKSCAI